jgi:hypothetical protein
MNKYLLNITLSSEFKDRGYVLREGGGPCPEELSI